MSARLNMHQRIEHARLARQQRVLHLMRNPMPLAHRHVAVDFDMNVDQPPQPALSGPAIIDPRHPRHGGGNGANPLKRLAVRRCVKNLSQRVPK